MVADRQNEHDREPSEHWYQQALKTISNIKIGWLLTSLVIVSGVAYTVSFLLARTTSVTQMFVAGLVRLIADASLSSAIVGFAYEWLVREETSRALSLLFRRGLKDQEATIVNAVVREIPRALLLDKEVRKMVFLAPEQVDELLKGALTAKLGDEEMSGSVYEGLLQKTFSYTRRSTDLRVEVTLLNVREDEPPDVRNEFFDVVLTLRNRTRLDRTRFIFARALDYDQYNARTRDPDYLFTWRLEETETLPRGSSRALAVYRFAVDELELPQTTRNTDDGAYEIVYEDSRLQEKLGKEVSLHYSLRTKLHRYDHVFFHTTTRPTRGVTVIFNYASADIDSVLTYDFFVSAKVPVIYQVPPERPQTTVVEVDEWIFPKGGVAFVWRLKGERERLAAPAVTG